MFRPPNETKPFDWSRPVKRLAVVILAGVLVLVALEIGVRVLAPQDLISDVMELGGPVCHQLEPGVQGVQRSSEYAVDIRINEQGLRDHYHPYRKRGDVFRILMLGDSHTFGWGVAMEEAFPQVLEGSLNASGAGGTAYEVINAGTIGFGTGHQYQYLTTYGVQFEPDLVVMVVDFVHDVIANNERYTIREGKPVRNSRTCVFEASRSVTWFVPFAGALRGHSHAFRFFGTRAVDVIRHVMGSRGTAVAEGRATDMDLGTTQGIVVATRDALRERMTEFAVVILPEFRQYDEEQLHAFEHFLRDNGIAYVSLGVVAGRDFFPSELTFARSPHFNAVGHQFLAAETEEFLEASGKLDRLRSSSSSGSPPSEARVPRR